MASTRPSVHDAVVGFSLTSSQIVASVRFDRDSFR